jgi:hypothetical protein
LTWTRSPKHFRPDTGGLGYVIGPDNRQAPMRVGPVPSRMRRSVPEIASPDDAFDAALSTGMLAWRLHVGGQPSVAPDPAPADDAPEGRRCADAVWQVLADSGQPMERGEIIKWVSELATTGWDRDKPFSIRAVTNALSALTASERITRLPGRDGVYQVTVTQHPPGSHDQRPA